MVSVWILVCWNDMQNILNLGADPALNLPGVRQDPYLRFLTSSFRLHNHHNFDDTDIKNIIINQLCRFLWFSRLCTSPFSFASISCPGSQRTWGNLKEWPLIKFKKLFIINKVFIIAITSSILRLCALTAFFIHCLFVCSFVYNNNNSFCDLYSEFCLIPNMWVKIILNRSYDLLL